MWCRLCEQWIAQPAAEPSQTPRVSPCLEAIKRLAVEKWDSATEGPNPSSPGDLLQ
jgi:hypothetical protein